MLDGRGALALVSADAPVVVLRDSEDDLSPALDSRPEILRVSAIDAPELRTDVPVLLAAFPALDDVWADDPDRFDPECFTAEVLWLATV